jgi:hypothetical protein
MHASHKLVYATKCRKEPLCCLKCHGWNHITNECLLAQDICGTCGGSHRTTACDNATIRFCTPCSMGGHTMWDRNCPTFQWKCEDLDARSQENRMPYFPTDEDWTQVIEPCNPPRLQHPPTQNHNQAVQRPPCQGTIAFAPTNRSAWNNTAAGQNDQRNWNPNNGPMDNRYRPQDRPAHTTGHIGSATVPANLNHV